MRAVGILLLGTCVGLQYGLLAIGLVLVYRAGRFVNFAQAQVGVFAAVVLGRLVIEAHLPYGVALVAGLLVVAATGAILERSVIQKLFAASRLTLLIATIALAQGLFAITQFKGLHVGHTAILPGSPLRLDQAMVARHHGGFPLPFAGSITVGGVVLDSGQLVTLVVGPAIAVGFWVVFTRTLVGRRIRAASSNPESARLAGISPRRISLLVWIVAAMLSGLAAILAAPSQPTITTTAQGPGLLLRGLAAALLAGFVDFRLAFLGGIAVGVVEQVAQYNIHTTGVTELAVMAVLVAGVVLRGRTLARGFRTGDDRLTSERTRYRASGQDGLLAGHVDHLGWGLLMLSLVCLPFLPGVRTEQQAQSLTEIVAFALVGVSLTVLVGWAGQVSLGHYALMGIGAYVAAIAATRHHWGLPAVILAAGGATAVAALIVGLPALWFRGLFLAVTTLGLAVVSQAWLFYRPSLGADSSGSASLPLVDVRMPLAGRLQSYRQGYFLALALLALALLGARALRSSGAGRAMVAMRDNERAASTTGFTPTGVKAAALALSGFLVGVAGAVFAASQTVFVASSFDPVSSLVMLSVVIVGGLGTLVGPVLGAFAVFAWPLLVPDQNNVVVQTFSSTSLVLAVLLWFPGGLGSLLQSGRDALLLRLDQNRVEAVADDVPPMLAGTRDIGMDDPPEEAGSGPAKARLRARRARRAGRTRRGRWTDMAPVPGSAPLEVREVSIAFGGIQALSRVSMTLREGEIVGLIGGNGAGKTTLLNCVSGLLRPDSGRVLICGQDGTDLPAQFRPTLGVGRSYQDAALYPGLTVSETAALGLENQQHTGVIGAFLGAPWVAAAEIRKRDEASRALGMFGLTHRGHTLTTDLSTGMRRLADLASLVAWGPRVILLDEPTAGIAQREVEAFGPLLRSLRDRLGCSIVLIEHDMPLVMSVSDRVYCLSGGKVVAEGSPDQVSHNPTVVASYLGTERTAIARSGRPPLGVET